VQRAQAKTLNSCRTSGLSLVKRQNAGLEAPIPALPKVLHCQPLHDVRGKYLQFQSFDEAYLRRLQSGDIGTQEHFSAYFGSLIRIKLGSRLNSREAIEDVRQETFARFFVALRAGKIFQPDRLGAFVNSICNNVLLEHYRSNRRTDSNLDEEPESAMVADEVSASKPLEVDDAARVVRATLSSLPERDRRLLQSVLLEERDKDEVCAELGLSREYLRVLVHRAKQAFKARYMKRWRGAE